jgi:Putative general bacterial porin
MENFMKFSKSILSTAVLLSSTFAMANTYNAEVELNYTDNGLTLLDNTAPLEDVSTLQLSGLYNFTAVDTTNKPLAEAAFLGKHSYLNASHSEFDADGGGSADAQTIGFGFYIPSTIFYVGVQHLKFEDTNDTAVTLGITPIDGLLVTTSHNEEAEDYNANISAKYVTQLAGDTSINLEAAYAKGEDAEDEFEEDAEDTLYLAADYYFTSFFSVGATLVDQDESTYGIRTRYFFNDQFSLTGEFTSSDEDDAMSVGAAFRF